MVNNSCVQQTLTCEASAILKHAVAEACRRAHAHATPLHVAATLLTAPGSPLRRACLQTHAQAAPLQLQCRGLELCFNVALDRLPASPPQAQAAPPAYSNALVAALKRAQAHQRRGCPEQQQQPLLAVKVELEHLLISILDDPTVSRVMAEAGFSSTLVKRLLEETVTHPSPVLEQNPTPGFRLGYRPPVPPPPPFLSHLPRLDNSLLHLQSSSSVYANPRLLNPSMAAPLSPPLSYSEDIRHIMDVLLSQKRRNPVLVGNSGLRLQSVMSELTNRIEKGEMPDELRRIRSFPAHFSSHLLLAASKDDIDKRFRDLRELIKRFAQGGVIIHIGDLQWLLDGLHQRDLGGRGGGDTSSFCPIQHTYKEMGQLIEEASSTHRLWLICTASSDTYFKCQMNYPTLESEWELQPIPINSSTLGIGLQARLRSHETANGNSSPFVLAHASLPSQSEKQNWCSDAMNRYETLSLSLKDHERYAHSESSHSCSSSVEAPIRDKPMEQHIPMESCKTQSSFPPWLLKALPSNVPKVQQLQKPKGAVGLFQSMDPDTFKRLYNGLAERVGWQKQIISLIANTVVECRSGVRKRHGVSLKGDTWLLFLGPDRMGKRRMAESLVELIFGSDKHLICIDLGPKSSRRSNTLWTFDLDTPSGFSRGKMPLDQFAEAVKVNPFSVVLLEDVDRADMQTKKKLRYAMEKGRLQESNGCEVSLSNVIVVMSSGIGSGAFASVGQDRTWMELSEEKLSAIPEAGMRVAVRGAKCEKVLWQVNPKVAVVDHGSDSCWPLEEANGNGNGNGIDGNKRKAERVFEESATSKRKALSLDLNLSVEQNEPSSHCIGDKPGLESEPEPEPEPEQEVLSEASKQLEGFCELADAAVVFRPYDFDSLFHSVLRSLQGTVSEKTSPDACPCQLEIDVRILERILAAAWWRRREDFDCWVGDVLKSVLDRCDILPGTVVKFLPAGERASADAHRLAALGLPTDISVELAGNIT